MSQVNTSVAASYAQADPQLLFQSSFGPSALDPHVAMVSVAWPTDGNKRAGPAESHP
jgi:hypothetical protein